MGQLRRRKASRRSRAQKERELMRMHERNLVSQYAKEILRDRNHTDAITFERDRIKLVKHEEAMTYLGRERCKRLLAYFGFENGELKQGEKEELEDNNWHVPKHVFRVASAVSSKQPPYYQSTKGLDSKDVHVPGILCEKHDGTGKDKGKYYIARNLVDEPNIIKKIGNRLMWYDRNSDPFLSWTNSMLFVLVLGTARVARGETFIHITSIDTEQADGAKVVERKHKFGTKEDLSIDIDLENDTVERVGTAKFYHTERLLRVTNARCWKGWKKSEARKLCNDWFTGEWLTHGIVLSDKGSYQANLLDLLEGGLYDFHDQLTTEDNEDMRSLYHRCVRARSLAFSVYHHPLLVTEEELQACSNLAALFMSEEDWAKHEGDVDSMVPPLHIFLSIVGLRKRIRLDGVFMDWIRARYSAADIKACGFHKTTKIANNLPEVMETIHLARDACIALGVEEIPQIPVWLADPDFNFEGQWLHDMPKEIKLKRSSASKLKKQHPGAVDKSGLVVRIDDHKDGWDVYQEWV